MKAADQIERKDVFVVSGGAKGITAACVIALAQAYQPTLILLGRSQVIPEPQWAQGCEDSAELKRRMIADKKAAGQKITPKQINKALYEIESSRQIRATLAAVSASGAQVQYISVDITDAKKLKRVLKKVKSEVGLITGIIHAAGQLADKRIERKTRRDYQRVVSAKVQGLESILAQVDLSQLKNLVLFSSVAGFYGNAGQADYALANEILNKTAHKIQADYPSCRVISINWGAWEAGMVTPALKKLFSEHGIEMIRIQQGVAFFMQALRAEATAANQVVVGPGLPALAPVLENSKPVVMQRTLTRARNPFVEDHRIGEYPVLPATCAAAWAANCAEQYFPGYKFRSIRDYRVLKGIVFNDDLAQEHELVLDKGHITDDGLLELEVRISSRDVRGRERFHYHMILQLSTQDVPVLQTRQLDSFDGVGISGADLYSDGTLFHGPAFQGVQRVLETSRSRVIIECRHPRLTQKEQGQFPARATNPYLNDTIVQSLLIWSWKYQNAPCLPSSLEFFWQDERIDFDETFYAVLDVRSETELRVVGDLDVVNGRGEICIRIRGLEGTISKHLAQILAHNPEFPEQESVG